MSTLSDADTTTEATLHLAQMNDAGDPNNLQHSVIMRGLRESVVFFGSPWIASGTPTEEKYYEKTNHSSETQ